jgi:hypothetical protein
MISLIKYKEKIWSYFLGKGLGLLVKVNGKIKHHDYIQILESYKLLFINNNYNRQNYFIYLFQDNNAFIHITKNVKKWIETKKIKILEN